MAIPQIKFGFFLAFKQSVWPFPGLFLALFGFLLKLLSGNCDCGTSTRSSLFKLLGNARIGYNNAYQFSK